MVPAGILALPDSTLCLYLEGLGPLEFILQLLCNGSGEKEILALCFVVLSLYFVKKALGMLSPALKVHHEPLASSPPRGFTHFGVSIDSLQTHGS
jgi:hypothetical protein